MKSSPLHHRIHKHVVHHVHRVHKHVSHHTTHLLSSIRKAQLYRWYRAHLPAFTLTDTLVATGIFLILTSTVLVAINPLKMFVDSRNNKRIRELKVVRDSLVQYTTDNTAGATNILGVSIPPCTESPGTEIGTGEGKVDLSNLSGFIPTYLASVPIDPKIGTAASTGYRVCRKSDLDYCVTAMYPESAGGSTVTMDCDYSIITPSPTPPGTPTSTPTPTVAPVTSGLVLSHQMSAGTGTTSLDETTNANNGTLTNGPTWTTGYLGSAISFDGTNDYISVPHSSTLALTGDMTITAWVNPTDRSNYFGIIGKTSGNTAAPYDFYLTGTTGIPRLLRGNGSDSASVDATAAPATGQWSHVAVVMSGTTVTHYLNGVANGSGTLSTTIADTGGALRIGSRADDVTMFKGVMDDVRIYNRALNADEISRIKAPAPTPTATATPTPTPQIAATGGTITDAGGYRIHTFTTSGTFTVTQGGNVETLVVAGGGGGAAMTGGGGGAGGLIYDASHAVTAQAYSITVGAGGAGQVGTANPGNGSDGQNSVFSTLTAVGGGGAGTNSGTGRPGGSGGGAGHNNTAGGAGTSGQGYAGSGGNTTSPNYGAGGGGGAGAVGGTPTNTQGGNGGVGLSYSMSGSSVYYAGGGGGGVYNGGTPGQGGLGGGGNAPAGNATANTGGGGGGQSNNLTDGGAGGSGIVIIRYAYTALTSTPSPTPTSTPTSTPTPTPLILALSNQEYQWHHMALPYDLTSPSDSKTDFVVTGASTWSGNRDHYVCVSDASSFGYTCTSFDVSAYGMQPQMVSDMNGDGLADFVKMGHLLRAISLCLSQVASPYFACSDIGDFSAIDMWSGIYGTGTVLAVPDRSGDGKIDLIGAGADVMNTQNAYSCNSTTAPDYFTCVFIGGINGWSGYDQLIGDRNSDGKPEVYLGPANDQIGYCESQVASPYYACSNVTPPFGESGYFVSAHYALEDRNSDGFNDIIAAGKNAWYTPYDNYIKYCPSQVASPYFGTCINIAGSTNSKHWGPLVELSDRNSDGLKEFIIGGGDSIGDTTNQVCLSDTNPGNTSKYNCYTFDSTYSFMHGVEAYDRNADGIKDVIMGESSASGSLHWCTSQATSPYYACN